ncbi:MAG: GGDEF domain-containing protein, partial [Chloroflexi bacterium]|nr:GGDEF domain-containing protein [Chloroflexota bacterium]
MWLLNSSPGFARALLMMLADRVRQADERVAREARDPLTNLPNRGMLGEYYGRMAARQQRQGGDMTLALLDVDYLKRLNDTMGHNAGDLALKSVAKALRATLRGMDLAVRWGGDEFAVLLPSSEVDGAHVVMARVRAFLSSLSDGAEPLTVSYGVAAAHTQRGDTVPSLEVLLAEADRALYAEKERRHRTMV